MPTTTEKYYSHLLKLLPVTEPVYGEGSAAVWTVTDPNHPILAGLPAQWSDGAGFSFVVAKSNATVLVQNTNGVPLVTVSEAAGGTVVHLNHDMTYTITALGPEIRQLIVNAVTFAGHLQNAIRLAYAITEFIPRLQIEDLNDLKFWKVGIISTEADFLTAIKARLDQTSEEDVY